ncbi:uncharacterized protein LOC114259276 [Camellia sinensis]|uniref:uncharacterized protein LOC114259276 n=1 Tax=Camellia sinensis TaxID=4442 RepID=UPI001036383E|nr:uncharacterized protein LOC114259276 [Camellia sinensis]
MAIWGSRRHEKSYHWKLLLLLWRQRRRRLISLLAAILVVAGKDNGEKMLKAVTMNEELLDSEIGSNSHCGSVRGRKVIHRDHIQGHERLFLDYFDESPKITVALRMLAYGVAADFMDEYVRIGESTAIESLKYFVKAVVDIFSNEYLRSPNSNEIAKLLAVSESHGFSRMLGSSDCMHWKWKNCPTALKGMYTGHIHEPTIILEAVASYDLWIWQAFFGLPGSHNDINVLERSFVFTELAQGRAPAVNYTINGNEYTMGYYLADGIYPQWSTFVKTIPSPQGNKKKLFAAAQEATRKDVERAFGVLQARFAIVRRPARFWNTKMLKYIMKACIILHNMIIEDERDDNGVKDFNYDQIDDSPHVTVLQERTIELMEFIQCHHNIRDRQTHSHLQSGLVEHLWQLHSEL